MAVRRGRSCNLHIPFPPSTFPTLQPHVDVCGEGLGWLFSVSPGHLLEPGGKNKTEKFWVCILAGVRRTKKVQESLVWHVQASTAADSGEEASMPVDDKPSATRLLCCRMGVAAPLQAFWEGGCCLPCPRVEEPDMNDASSRGSFNHGEDATALSP